MDDQKQPATHGAAKETGGGPMAMGMGLAKKMMAQIGQPRDEDGVHRRPRHTWRIMRMVDRRRLGLADAAPGQHARIGE